jgi:hypothetical protein
MGYRDIAVSRNQAQRLVERAVDFGQMERFLAELAAAI